MREKHFIIAYDIADNKRRAGIVKWLMNYAYRVQYSVFEMTAADSVKEQVVAGMNKLINGEEDSVLIYELCMPDWSKKQKIGVQNGEENIYANGYAIIE